MSDSRRPSADPHAAPSEPVRLAAPGHDLVGIRAANPGPLSLSGTNTWIVGRDPAWLIDPGPELPAHLDALDVELALRGGLGGIGLTHDHPDHIEALPALRARHPGVPWAAARGEPDVQLLAGVRFGPLEAVPVPGHAPDHVCFVHGSVLFSGDAVLGEGSVFIAPGGGGLGAYLAALRELRERAFELICPAHGPIVEDPGAKLTQYIEHREDRERRLLAALAAGARDSDAMLDAAWPDATPQLRPIAAISLAAHLEKLEQEGRLPDGVRWPELPF